jgi:hypothetical protein
MHERWHRKDWKDSDDPFLRNCYQVQKELWNWYKSEIRNLQPIDILICNGDAIDGPGQKCGGLDLAHNSIDVKVEIASHTILEARAIRSIIMAGTDYHTGSISDAEKAIADRVGGEFLEEGFFDINGVLIDVRHFFGGGRALATTPSALKRMINEDLIKVMRDDKRGTAEIYLRAHIHKYEDVPGFIGEQRAFTSPALQARGSRFGIRKCSGIYDIGFLSFNIIGKGNWTWKKHMFQPEAAVVVAQKL